MDLMCCESDYTQRAYEDPVLLRDERVLQNLLATEDKYVPPSSYFTCVQTDIKPFMRKMAAQWMLEVCEEQQCEEEVFPLSMNYMDRFLCVKDLGRNQLQLLGAASVFLASKLKESRPLTAEKVVMYTDNSITFRDLMEMESMVLSYLKWDLSAITPHDFLQQILTRLELDQDSTLQIKRHAQTFIALCATDCKFMLYPPSMMAAGCVGAACKGLSRIQDRKLLPRLQRITGIEMDCLRSCQEQIEQTVAAHLQSLNPPFSETPRKGGSGPQQEQPTTPTEVHNIHI